MHPGHPGLVRRLMEHLFAAYRPKHPEARKVRYRLCRNTPVERLFSWFAELMLSRLYGLWKHWRYARTAQKRTVAFHKLNWAVQEEIAGGHLNVYVEESLQN